MNAPYPVDWLALFGHFVAMSLLSIGGAITTAPEMHRYTVDEQHWLSDAQFNASVALAQAAPGPNVIFIAVLGWQIGVNSGHGYWSGALGVLCACRVLAVARLRISSVGAVVGAGAMAMGGGALPALRAMLPCRICAKG